MLRLVNTGDVRTQHRSRPGDGPPRAPRAETARPGPALERTDARWVMAARVASLLDGGQAAILTPERREMALRAGNRLGLRPFDAALIIAAVQDAARWGEPALSHAVAERVRAVAEAPEPVGPGRDVGPLGRVVGGGGRGGGPVRLARAVDALGLSGRTLGPPARNAAPNPRPNPHDTGRALRPVQTEPAMPLIDPGKKAPAFTLKDQDGVKHALKDHAGRHVVLFFYPKDMTSGCTSEACQFRDLLPKFEKIDAAVFGVSILGEKSKKKFAEKEGLNYPLLADDRLGEDGKPDPAICQKYGVWVEKSMYGKTYMGIQRTTYLIGPTGKVLERWDKVKTTAHAEAVLNALAEHA